MPGNVGEEETCEFLLKLAHISEGHSHRRLRVMMTFTLKHQALFPANLREGDCLVF